MSVLNNIIKINKLYSRNSGVLRTYLRYSSSQSEFLRSPFPDLNIPDVNIVDYVMQDFGRWPNKIALECGITGRKYTFDDVRIKSNKFGMALKEILKLKKGDALALVLPNVPEYGLCVFGAMKMGITITTVNPIYTPAEVERQFIDSDTKAVVTLGMFIPLVKAATAKINKNIPIIAIKSDPNEQFPEGTIIFNDLLGANANCKEDPIFGDEIAVIPYSSGTTGLPKGVELTNNNLVANVTQYNYDAEPEREHDILPSVLPMFHIYGFTNQILGSLQKGIKLVTLPKFTPELYLSTIVKQKVTALMLVPPIVLFLNSHPAVKREHLQHLRCIVCGGAPLSANDEAKFKEKVGKNIPILQGYGLTETSPLVLTVPEGKEKDGGMGYVVNNTIVKVVSIDDPDCKHLSPNNVGELLVKGPQVMKGYHNKPKETEEAFWNGFLRTGDLVRYDEDGMFYICDRIKELIKVKGFQVPPAELEEVIRRYPGVGEAAVIGVPHERYGEAPKAYIVQKQGSKIDVDKLVEFVNANVAPYKQLSGGVSIVDNIPKNPSGKILRRQLKILYEK
ncbi:uncharacterized protein [Onthophagus taurus]|uniref:uncharacterized protein n=1 Tax=Onthophagus taurus TaxID=166361 RepID=UPI0039BDA776